MEWADLRHVLRQNDLCLSGIAPSDALGIVPSVQVVVAKRSKTQGDFQLGLCRLLLSDVGRRN